MSEYHAVEHLDVERLLSEWRWLCPQRMELVARTPFAGLFLRNDSGEVFLLNTAVGTLTEVAASEAAFREAAETRGKRRDWFAEPNFQVALERGLHPTSSQCIGFSIPTVFAKSGTSNKPYIADVYEYISFLGNLHRQIASVPDGAKVEIRVVPPRPIS